MGGRILLWLEHGIYKDLEYKRASKNDENSPTNIIPLSPPITKNSDLSYPPKSCNHSPNITPNHSPHATVPMESIGQALPFVGDPPSPLNVSTKIMKNDTGTGTGVSPSLADAVNHRIAQLEAESQRALTRSGQRRFGTVDQSTTHDPRIDIKRAVRSQQYAVETGQDLHVRPALVESAQTKYLGVEERLFGQEIHHAVFLNARMLIHDPDTGMPGIRTGHLYAELHTNPVEPYRRWPLEVPCVSHQDVQAAICPQTNRCDKKQKVNNKNSPEAPLWLTHSPQATLAAHQLASKIRATPPIAVGMLHITSFIRRTSPLPLTPAA
ncbi:hypothetical protein B0H16DRAFT_1576557 [Mycena metata]|uniref:Uncharacterized protein n=1 Tax=Mycena metata TaxID=1033252 RepID=A0AAD7I4W2_9AGAR|nr:hypothetical protein B0H16DRAFT_1576557 [Mycena metata]